MDRKKMCLIIFGVVLLILSIVVIVKCCLRKDYFESHDAVSILQKGNKKYMSRLKKRNAKKTKSVAVLLCSDLDFVSPHEIFGLSEDEVYVVKEAGQVAYLNTMASLEYAVGQLGVKSLVVLGHTQCDTVRLAMGAQPLGTPYLNFVGKSIKEYSQPDDSLSLYIENNARETLHTIIRGSDLIRNNIDKHELTPMWAIYNEENGEVKIYQT